MSHTCNGSLYLQVPFPPWGSAPGSYYPPLGARQPPQLTVYLGRQGLYGLQAPPDNIAHSWSPPYISCDPDILSYRTHSSKVSIHPHPPRVKDMSTSSTMVLSPFPRTLRVPYTGGLNGVQRPNSWSTLSGGEPPILPAFCHWGPTKRPALAP